MTGTQEALERAASSDTARRAADTAGQLREELGELASDVSRKVENEFARAKNIATDVYEGAHGASKDYPHITIAVAAALGFLAGLLVTRR